MDERQRTVRILRKEYLFMVEAAKNGLPNEACGLLAGEKKDDVCAITKVYALKNTDASPEHFSIDPKEQLQTIKDIRGSGLVLLGNWHSHPSTPSRPSEEDKRLAFDKNAVYLILSLAEKEPILNAFHIEGVESRKEKLEIIE